MIDAEEDARILRLVNTPALDFLSASNNAAAAVNGGRKFIYRRPKIMPPEGYLCRRCHVAGHFIQHCPTNGDPNYDIKIIRPAKGIPKSMLLPDPDGCYSTASGEAVVLRPNEAAFDKEMEGLLTRTGASSSSSSSWSVDDLPPQLLCPLCKKVMKDAVMTTRCCFKSFCDQCIRECLNDSRGKCECGETEMLADYLIPNITLRHTITRLLESGPVISSSGSGSGKATSVPHCSQVTKETSSTTEHALQQTQTSKRARTEAKSVVDDASGSMLTTTSKETLLKGHEGLVAGEVGKRKKRKRATPQDFETHQSSSSACNNPYWSVGMWNGMEGYDPKQFAYNCYNPYYTASAMSYGSANLMGSPYGELNVNGGRWKS